MSLVPVDWPPCADEDVVELLPFAALPDVLPVDAPEDVLPDEPDEPVEPAAAALDVPVPDAPADEDELPEPAALFSRTATAPGVTEPVELGEFW